MNSVPGIYINVLTNEEGISTNASDKRRAARSALVNKDNIKFGISVVDVHRRADEYSKTFGKYVKKEWYLELPNMSESEIKQFEKEILQEVDEKRVVNPLTGRKQEWLENIKVDELVEIIEAKMQRDQNA